MNILVVSDSLRDLPPAVAALEASGHRIAYVDDLTPLPEIAARGLADLAQTHALVTSRLLWLDAEALALLPRIRVIALHTSGSDNVDLPEATRRGIVVTNVKGVNAEQCAEFSVGLLLAVTRQIRTGDIAIRDGAWASRSQTSLDPYGATVGVVGLGLIGKAAVRRLKAFGVRLLCHTRTPDSAFGAEMGMTYTDLDTLLRESDVVSLYASLTESTCRMIGARELGLMKPGAYLINIARGELIDEPALVEALRTAGADLDVSDTEPLTESPLFALDNVVLTLHQAGLAASAKVNAAVRVVNNALAALSGRIPPDAINPEAFRAP